MTSWLGGRGAVTGRCVTYYYATVDKLLRLAEFWSPRLWKEHKNTHCMGLFQGSDDASSVPHVIGVHEVSFSFLLFLRPAKPSSAARPCDCYPTSCYISLWWSPFSPSKQLAKDDSPPQESHITENEGGGALQAGKKKKAVHRGKGIKKLWTTEYAAMASYLGGSKSLQSTIIPTAQAERVWNQTLNVQAFTVCLPNSYSSSRPVSKSKNIELVMCGSEAFRIEWSQELELTGSLRPAFESLSPHSIYMVNYCLTVIYLKCQNVIFVIPTQLPQVVCILHPYFTVLPPLF